MHVYVCVNLYVFTCECARACVLDYGPKFEHFLQRAAAACTYEHVCVSVFV